MGTKNLLAIILLISLLVAVSQNTHAMEEINIVPENVIKSGQNAWSAISDFMGEVWQDTTNVASLFFQTIVNDFKVMIIGIIKTLGVIRGWITQFIPVSLQKVFIATGDFFLQLFQYFDDLVKNAFTNLKPPATVNTIIQ